MLPTLRALLPLFISAGILLGGGGLIATVLSIGAKRAGFDPTIIGFLGTFYFAGYIAGCFINPLFVRSVGHIRVFAAYSAIAAATTLVFALIVHPVIWIAARTLMGFCFSGLFIAMEGWLNAASTNANRARVFSVYRIIDMACVAAGQYLMPAFGIGGFAVFAVISILTAISVVPVALGDRSNPRPPEEFKLDLKTIWLISPLACAGCFFVGLTNTAFRLIGPIYTEDAGLELAQVATFIAVAVAAAALIQFPLGWLSDRVDRRLALIIASGGAALAALTLAATSVPSLWLMYGASLVYGGLSLPLYPLLSAHANDRARTGQYVVTAAGLSTFFSAGALAGPTMASELYAWFGAVGLFGFLATMQCSLIGLAIWRSFRRAPAPREKRITPATPVL
jgi:MFS family permease